MTAPNWVVALLAASCVVLLLVVLAVRPSRNPNNPTNWDILSGKKTSANVVFGHNFNNCDTVNRVLGNCPSMTEYELAKAAEQAATLASKNATRVNAAATAVVADPKNSGAVVKLANATGQAAADANKIAEGFREHLAPTYRVPKLDGFTSTTIPAGVIEGMCTPHSEYRSRIMPEGYMNEADNLGISTPFYDGCQ